MKKIILFAFISVMLTAQAAVKIPRTEIPYSVNYHWGIIDVMIAHGTVDIECDSTIFKGMLDGVSIPWEGRIILVSDTLEAQMKPGKPYSEENVIYQSGWYRHPKVNYYRSNSYDPSDPEIFKNIAGKGGYNASNNSMEAITVTSDMLGMFYYAREFDFKSMTPGEKFTMPIKGGYAHQVVVTYTGEGNYSIENMTYPTYNLEFEYSYGGSMSGYTVTMKVGQKELIPMFISASLPVGRVEMLYNP